MVLLSSCRGFELTTFYTKNSEWDRLIIYIFTAYFYKLLLGKLSNKNIKLSP